MYGRGGHLGRDPNVANKLSFPLPTEAPHEIWLKLAQVFLRISCLKSVDDGLTGEPAYTIRSPVSLKARVS